MRTVWGRILGVLAACGAFGTMAAGAFGAPAAPNTTITSKPAADVSSTTATFAFVSDQPATFQCSLDGAAWAPCTSPKTYSGLTDGSHGFQVRAINKKRIADATPAVATWTVDTTPPPAPSIASAPASPTASTTASIAFSDTEAGTTFLCALDGAAPSACQSPASYASLSDGTHTFAVSARDAAGNTSAATSTTWTVDTGAPPAPNISSSPEIATADTTAAIAFDDADTGAAFLCSLDGAAAQPCTSPVSLSGLAVGTHSFSVQARDAAGNTSPTVSRIWAVQTEYVKNGSFEGSTSGWAGSGGTVSLATDGVVGTYALKVTETTPGWVSGYPSPRPILSTTLGYVYRAAGWVRSDTPNVVCLRVREYDSTGSTLLNSVARCVTSSATWQKFPSFMYTPLASGHQLTVFPYEPNAVSGDSFEADAISLVGGLPATLPTQGDPTLAAAGDISCAPSEGSYNNGLGDGTHCMQGATAQVIGDIPGLQAVVPLGDEQYTCGELSNFTSAYETSWGRFKGISHPVPGNHEYGVDAGTCAQSNAPGYYAYFGAAAGDPTQGYYSYDVGGWHVVALNAICVAIGGCGAGSPEETWLRNDLALHPAQCTLAYFHQPRWSAGPIGDEPQYDAFWRDLVSAHVDLVLNAHDHTYQRFTTMDGSGAASASGTREVIVGTGGDELVSPLTPRPTLQVADNTTFGVLQLVLHPTGYDAAFIPADAGSFSDVFSGSCT